MKHKQKYRGTLETAWQIMCLAAMIMFSTNSLAQRPNNGQAPSPEKILNMLDLDKDGKISMAEAKKSRKEILSKNFSHFDTNKDSFIDLEELKFAIEKRKNQQESNNK